MSIPVLTLPLRSKRDLLLVRQRARQLAGLLGFDVRAQLGISAAVFELAWCAFQDRGRSAIVFQIETDLFQVFAANMKRRPTEDAREEFRKSWLSGVPQRKIDPDGARRLLGQILQLPPRAQKPALRLELPLPRKALSLSPEDLVWAIQELARHTPLNLFEEIHLQNQELLRLLHEVQALPAMTAPAEQPRTVAA